MIAIYMGTVIFVLILLFWFVGTWNRLVRLEKDVDRAWSNIDTILQQRFDMIPNMVKIVQEYAGHEKEIFGDLSEARKTFAAASKGGDVSGVMAAESMLSQSMPKLLALSEAYPDLKANTNFLKLQGDYKEIEDSVTDQRQLYNSSATNFNTAIEIIPGSIVASIKGCKERILYEAEQKARESVSIEF
jgi:LemA protein